MRSTVKGGKSSVSRHSIVISGRKTSVSLEDEFWDGLKESAVARNIKLYTLVTKIDSKRQQANLSSAIRLSYWISISLKSPYRRNSALIVHCLKDDQAVN
jgi:predicted DNA-binding ribbon-helix-helix protein